MISRINYHIVFLLVFSSYLVDAQINSFPYNEGFESGLGVWTNAGGDEMDWTRDQGGTPSGGTGPSSGDASTWYLYTEASAPNFPSKRAFLEADVDFTGVFYPQLSFAYHMFGGSMGDLNVDVFNGVWNNSVWSIAGEQQSSNAEAYRQAVVDLRDFANQSGLKLRFRGTTGTDFTSDIALDNLSICTINPGTASISKSTLCASASVDLTLQGEEVGASIQWQQSTDNVIFSNLGGATSDSYTTAALAAGNTYYFRAAITSGCTSYSNVVSVAVSAGNGAINVFPHTNDFESGLGWTNGAGDDFDWTRDQAGTPSADTGPNTGNKGSTWYAYIEASAPNNPTKTAYLEQTFDFTGIADPEIEFYYHMFGTNSGSLVLDVGADQNVWSISGPQQSSGADAYKKVKVSLSSYGNSCNVRVRFRGISGLDWSSDIAIDDIVVRDACLSVRGGTVSVSDSLLCSSAPVDLSVIGQDGGATLQWQQSTDNVNFSDIGGASGANYSSGALATGATHYFRVAATNGCTSYSDTVSVIVNAGGGGVNTYPYNEGFEAGIGAWVNAAGDDFDWTRNSGGTGSAGTGPSGGSNGSTWYMYTEASGANFPLKTTFFEKEFDFSAVTHPNLSFHYHMFGADMGELFVDINGTNVWSLAGQQQVSEVGDWTRQDIDLSAYKGLCNVKIRFRGTTGTNFTSDMAIDDIAICTVDAGEASISDVSLCASDSVTLTLDSYEAGASFQWQQSTDGVTFSDIAGGTTVVFKTDALAVGNTYFFRCAVTSGGCTNFSNRVSVNVSSGGGINTFPYSEDFESGAGVWAGAAGDDFDWTNLSGTTPSAATGPGGGNSGTSYMYTEASGANFPLKTAFLQAEFDFSGQSNPQLTFFYHMFGVSMGTLYVDVNGVNVWSISGPQQGSFGAPWRKAEVDLSAYSNECSAIIRFRAVTGTNFYSDIAIDDINVCIKPSTSLITGAGELCAGSIGEAYSVSNTPSHSYNWLLEGGVKASGGTTNSITVNWLSTGQEAAIKVVESSGTCRGDTISKTVNLHSLPTSAIIGDTAVSENSSAVVYAVEGRSGYSYAWTITGGSVVSGAGTHSITVDWGSAGAGNVRVVATSGAPSPVCGSAAAVDLPVVIYSVIESVSDGSWNSPATWDCVCIPGPGDNVKINNTHDVSLSGPQSITNFTLASGGVFDNGGNILTVTADYTNNGEHRGAGVTRLTGVNTSISGTGVMSGSGDLEISGGNKTIKAGSALSKTAGDLDIVDPSIIITNNGSISLSNNLTALNGSDQWINAPNSSLTVGGSLLSSGLLNATGSGNTVNYNGTGAQTVKLPDGSQYHNLVISNSSSALLAGNTIIQGDLSITGTAQLDVTANGYNINLGGNWNSASGNADPFVERDGQLTLNGAGAQTITNTTNQSFYDLTINKPSGGVVIDGDNDLIVTHHLNMTKGILRPDDSEIIEISAGASASSNAGAYVAGRVRKIGNTAFVFPIGSAARYARLGISAPTMSSTFEADYLQTAYTNTDSVGTMNNVSTKEHWNLDRIAGVGNCQATLYWESGTFSGIDDLSSGDLVVAHWNSTTQKWEDVGGSYTGIVSAGSVTSGVLSSFSPFTFGSKGAPDNPLPVELNRFQAQKIQEAVELSWTTASETNNDYFSVERSADGLSYQEIGRVTGAGNSHELKVYQWRDDDPSPAMNYYRLKQVDFKGTFAYSEVRVINFSSEGEVLADVFPNPAVNQRFNISMRGDQEREVLLVLYNSAGQETYSKAVVQSVGTTLVAVELKRDVPPGIYIIVGSSDQELFRRRIILM